MIEKIINGVKKGIYNWVVPIAGVDASGNLQVLQVDASGGLSSLSGLSPAAGSYDNIVLDPPALPTRITYKLGAVTVATLTLTYSGSDVATITRT